MRLRRSNFSYACTTIWRQEMFGPGRRGKPGTIVKEKAYGANTPAYVVRAGRPTYLLFETGLGSRADFEVATPRVPPEDFVPARLWLPYGYWTLRDGSEVIFSRDYYPLWRIAGASVERLDPWIWIKNIASEMHFTKLISTRVWATGPARELALQFLTSSRIFELPKLVDVMPHLFNPSIDSVGGGVTRLHGLQNSQKAIPTYAEINSRLIEVRPEVPLT